MLNLDSYALATIMEPPIVLCGLGRVGWRILHYLRTTGLPLVVIDNTLDPADPRLEEIRLIRGDCRRRETLEQANIHACRGVLIVTSDDLVNISTALMVRSLNHEVRIVLRVFNENLIGRLGHAIQNIFPMSTSALTAPLLAAKALTGQAVGTIKVGGPDEERRQVARFTVPHDSHLRGQPLSRIAARFHAQIVAHLPAGEPARFLLEVDENTPLRAGDQLVVCGAPHHLAPLLAHGYDRSRDLRWASWFRRNGRMLLRTLREVDLSVKICTAVLLSVVAISVLVFRTVAKAHGVADPLYRVISLIATGADMKAEGYPDELKIYVSVLRIVGAALTAAFTAIVTNYLVRASLGGVLEVRRIPDGGHIVVAGLGSIGYRTVEELLQAGERVVAIETSRDNRFVPTVRRKGVPVILGDATLGEVLRQANAGTARAIVACTSNDLVNLEVALLARELNPHQRVVLLQSDPHLAQLLRDAANVRLAVSVPVLAAPAFVAGLFGDRVQNVFLVHDHILAVLDQVITPQDGQLADQSVRAVAIDHRLLPITVLPAHGGPPVRNPMNARLMPGDRLIAIISLTDLESLLKRKPVLREWAVDVTAYPPAQREWLQMLVSSSLKLEEKAADAALEQLPLRLQSRLTKGQAEDLLAMLQRERISAVLERVPVSGS